MPPVAAELALQLARSDRRHGAERAKAQEIQALELFRVEGELARRERSEECLCVVDLYEAAWPRARRGEPRGERPGRKTESRFAACGGAQPASSLADRLTRLHDSAHVQPRDALDANLDGRREVVERRRDELSQLCRGFGVRRKEGRLRAEVLGLA